MAQDIVPEIYYLACEAGYIPITDRNLFHKGEKAFPSPKMKKFFPGKKSDPLYDLACKAGFCRPIRGELPEKTHHYSLRAEQSQIDRIQEILDQQEGPHPDEWLPN